uniref:Family with sequence similarity 177 member B n=1 Tax=Erpetoichthys calabaricus TaxID=27687 RepID=A0A8C4SYP8_ERPCA
MTESGSAEQVQGESGDLRSVKVPRRVIHFANGETMDEFSTDEDDEEEKGNQNKLQEAPVDKSQLSWGSYLWFLTIRFALASLNTCDFLGGKLANILGLNTPKYQYAIDEHHRRQNEGSEDDDEEYELEEQNCNESQEGQHLSLQNAEYGAIKASPKAELFEEKSESDGSGTVNTSYGGD